MASRGSAVHVVTTTREYKGKVYKTHLLRRSFREDGKVKNETVGNLSHLPDELVEVIRRSLRGESFVPSTDAVEITASAAHGHVHAVRRAMQRLGFDTLISSRPSRERDLVVAMVAARIVAPQTKLATSRWWAATTLGQDLGVGGTDEEDLYSAMDWLQERQGDIEKKLAARHLGEGSIVLFDLSSSYFEGTTCPLAERGYNRDGKKDKLQVNYGLLADVRGCPVAVSVFSGSTGDPKTFLPQIQKIQDDFAIEKMVMVGDRGMISQKTVDVLRETKGVDWITALKSIQIQKLVEGGDLQLGLFDEKNLFELSHPDYPGERLVACRNGDLSRLRAHKRQSLIEATIAELDKIKGMVSRGRLREEAAIGVRVGRVINKYKVAKHFVWEIKERSFEFHVNQESVAAEAKLDGVYVIRTSLPKKKISASDAVRTYKQLSNVERAFRTIKTVDLKVRPIHHVLPERVRAHIFLCTLAYYVEWHMREAWRSILFADEDQAVKATRDPVAPAERSEAALDKVSSKELPDGTPVHSFRTLLDDLATIVRNTCRAPQSGDSDGVFHVTTTASSTQRRALELLEGIKP